MAQQRLWVALLVVLLLNTEPIASHNHINVGDDQGWTYGVHGWPEGKVFYHGQYLVFNYGAGIHNVVRVDRQGYESCTPNANSETKNSGHDIFELKKGMNYFICGLPGHCQSGGMSIAVYAR